MRLKLFGGAALTEQQEAPIASRRRSLALLALVATSGERGLSRDKIVAYLWPESDAERARHALAQTLYALRRELSADAVLTVGNDLRLRRDLLSVDLWEFEAALARGDPEAAAAVYGGAFLDGFYLTGAPEFERWVESERARWAHDYKHALQALAKDAELRHETQAAAEWWRRAVSADRLDAQLALRYMQALVACGDRSAAIRHGRVYETLIREELKLPPDPVVRAYIQQLRQQHEVNGTKGPTLGALTPAVARVAPDSEPLRRSSPQRLLSRSTHPSDDQAEVDPPSSSAKPLPPPPSLRRSFPKWRRTVATLAAFVILTLLSLSLGGRLLRHAQAMDPPVLAVGSIREFGGSDTSGVVRVLAEMLATNIARVPSLRVVSNTRIYELLAQITATGGNESARLAHAAERAGATQIIEGVLYRRPSAALRLDVQRIDMSDGRVLRAYSVEGGDLFALVDSATAKLAGDLRVAVGTLRVADVTTTSLVAERFYLEGLRAFFQVGDSRSALRLFQLALQEDSTFAMAAYYGTHAAIGIGDSSQLRLGRDAIRLSARVSERERYLINGELRDLFSDPLGRVYAESLVSRYPNEPLSNLVVGNVLVNDGEFLAALPYLRRAIALDSASFSRQPNPCRACEALGLTVEAYWSLDSTVLAERAARQLATRVASVPGAVAALASVLERAGRADDALRYWARVAELQGSAISPMTRIRIKIRAAQFGEADAMLATETADGSSLPSRLDALWFTIISKRYQGQLAAARQAAEQIFRLMPDDYVGSQALGQILFETSRYSESANLFSKLARRPNYPGLPSRTARDVAWDLAHAANAVAAAGDTVRLKRLADSLQSIGARSSFGRDARLHHFARGLLARARVDELGAIDEFQQAICSTTMGYTRANFELARSLLTLHRPAEAVPMLQAALRGSLEAANFYLTHTEVHELLARAFDEMGATDSARVHYEWVATAWQHADPQFEARLTYARRRVAALRAMRAALGSATPTRSREMRRARARIGESGL